MVYTSDLEEYLRLRQIFQPSSEKRNSHAETSAMQPSPPFAGQPSLPSTDCPLYDPSMSHASAFLGPTWTTPTAIGHATAGNFYQSNMQTSPTVQYSDTEVGTEDHLSPGQTTTHTWSSTPSPSTQESSPPNQRDSEGAIVESNFVHGDPQQQE